MNRYTGAVLIATYFPSILISSIVPVNTDTDSKCLDRSSICTDNLTVELKSHSKGERGNAKSGFRKSQIKYDAVADEEHNIAINIPITNFCLFFESFNRITQTVILCLLNNTSSRTVKNLVVLVYEHRFLTIAKLRIKAENHVVSLFIS